MGDLSTIDDTQPANSEVVGLGASRMRELRDAVLASFDLEHALTGQHTLAGPTTATRPSPTILNHVIHNLNRQWEVSDGSAWQLLRSVFHQTVYQGTLQNVTPGAGYAQLISNVINVSARSFILALFRSQLVFPFTGSGQLVTLTTRFALDGAPVINPVGGVSTIFAHNVIGSQIEYLNFVDWGYYSAAGFGVSEGNHTLAYQASAIVPSSGNIGFQNRELLVLAI